MKIVGYLLVGLGGLALLGQLGRLMTAGGDDGHQASVSMGGIGFGLLIIVGGLKLILKAKNEEGS